MNLINIDNCKQVSGGALHVGYSLSSRSVILSSALMVGAGSIMGAYCFSTVQQALLKSTLTEEALASVKAVNAGIRAAAVAIPLLGASIVGYCGMQDSPYQDL